LNYYEHHIGDYDSATAHLSWAEDMAYTRLMRLYYRKEVPPPADVAEACRLIRAQSKEQKQAVEAVLKEFFVLSPDGWRQKRCDADIERYQKKAAMNREVGKKGGRPRKAETHKEPTKNPDGYLDEPTDNPLQTPSTSLQSPSSETKVSGAERASKTKVTSPEEIIFGYGVSLLLAASIPEKSARSFLGGLRKSHGDEALIDGLRDCIKAKPLQPLEWLAARLPPPKPDAAPAVKPGPSLTVVSNAADKTTAYIAGQTMTPEEKAASDEARRALFKKEHA
jgi:uncharacterized protein YdaU (DUF1376 family)